MRSNLSLRQLEAILAIADQGNFSSAAEHIHVSQPALSRTVRLAEESLGARIFDRDTRSVSLTAAGQELLPIARRIVSEFSDSMSELSEFMEGRRGRVRVAALPSMAQSLMVSVVAKFSVAHPRVDFVLKVDSADKVLALLETRSIDIGLTVQPPPDGRFTYQHLQDDEFVVICRSDDALAVKSHPSRILGWDVFADRRFIAASPGSNTRAATDAAFMEAGVTLRPAHEVDSSNLPIIGGLVAGGLGLTALPGSALSCLNQPGLVSRRLAKPDVRRKVGIVTLAGRTHSVATTRFIEQLQLAADTLLPAPSLA
jgi:DNA-binding transcriptional LysR family regulator